MIKEAIEKNLKQAGWTLSDLEHDLETFVKTADDKFDLWKAISTGGKLGFGTVAAAGLGVGIPAYAIYNNVTNQDKGISEKELELQRARNMLTKLRAMNKLDEPSSVQPNPYM